jgi:hypothetical protein
MKLVITLNKESKMKMQLEKLSDKDLQKAEDLINQIQEKRAKKHSINAERERVVLGVRNFLKRFASKETLF